jgi:predicted O-methyltransferase YrrM
MGFAYLKHRATARNLHGVHSPFVYKLNQEVLNAPGAVNMDVAKTLHASLLRRPDVLHLHDLGAGSRTGMGPARSIAHIAKHSTTPLAYGALLQRLVTFCGAAHILELGANLGITTVLLASSPAAHRLVSIEGDPALAMLASEHLQQARATAKAPLCDAQVLTGSFNERLPEALSLLRHQVHFAYIDGDHRPESTLCYFETILPYTMNHSMLAIGDIHWSSGMEHAWREMVAHPRVRVSIDLFHLGIVFFRREQAKEHFNLRLP